MQNRFLWGFPTINQIRPADNLIVKAYGWDKKVIVEKTMTGIHKVQDAINSIKKCTDKEVVWVNIYNSRLDILRTYAVFKNTHKRTLIYGIEEKF